jgi:hypothetical protein
MSKVNSRPSGACPTFFRGLCGAAKAGGAHSYKGAGYELARHTSGAKLMPDHLDADEWEASVSGLEAHVAAGDDEAILAFYDGMMPRCMALIPRDRRPAFLKGVYQYVEDNGNLS